MMDNLSTKVSSAENICTDVTSVVVILIFTCHHFQSISDLNVSSALYLQPCTPVSAVGVLQDYRVLIMNVTLLLLLPVCPALRYTIVTILTS